MIQLVMLDCPSQAKPLNGILQGEAGARWRYLAHFHVQGMVGQVAGARLEHACGKGGKNSPFAAVCFVNNEHVHSQALGLYIVKQGESYAEMGPHLATPSEGMQKWMETMPDLQQQS